jgi:hypothetical protein
VELQQPLSRQAVRTVETGLIDRIPKGRLSFALGGYGL